jgi:hypothetical protein
MKRPVNKKASFEEAETVPEKAEEPVEVRNGSPIPPERDVDIPDPEGPTDKNEQTEEERQVQEKVRSLIKKGYREGFAAARALAARTIDSKAQAWIDGLGREPTAQETGIFEAMLLQSVYVRALQIPMELRDNPEPERK